MKTNAQLGFSEIGTGCERAGERYTANLVVGRDESGGCRAYCTLYEHDQDASREGIRKELCARGSTVNETMAVLIRRAVDQWTAEEARGVRGAWIEAEDEILSIQTP